LRAVDGEVATRGGTHAEAPSDIHVVARLPQDAEAPAAARALVDCLLVSETLRYRLRLGVSELVTNGVCHAARRGSHRLEVRIRRAGGVIRVEVVDPGDGFAWPVSGRPAPAPQQRGGRGLYLVERLADRRGAARVAGGGLAWFEIDEAPAPQPRPYAPVV
jgi:anti-sigma regulatory factor (Ser/Thr protein kinase)